MPLPLIPIAAGLTGVAAGTALNAWLNQPTDAWADKAVFNARMRDMQSLAMALNNGFSACPAFMKNTAQLQSWRGTRDGFSKYYGQVGTLTYTSPNDSEMEQAKSYASRFYFWVGEYNRLKCGGGAPIVPTNPTIDPYNPNPPAPEPTQSQDWASIIKWSAIGVGGILAIKTLSDAFKR